jgi:cell wall-associated NlpC family hydrolase
MAEVSRNAGPVPGHLPLRWVEDFSRIPYRERGRDETGCDCWGLVALVYLRQAGIDLEPFQAVERTDGAAVEAVITREAAKWLPVSRGDQATLDVVVMRSIFEYEGRAMTADMHVGIVTKPGFILHTEAKTGTVHVPMTHHSVTHRIRAIYRHKVLA